jgi:hypothetical protein
MTKSHTASWCTLSDHWHDPRRYGVVQAPNLELNRTLPFIRSRTFDDCLLFFHSQ